MTAALLPTSAATLRASGRAVAAPLALSLDDGGGGDFLVVRRLLRVLPGKRIVGEGEWQGRRVLVKVFVAAGSARHWEKERQGIEALRAARLPTPELVCAVALRGGGHVLLTRYLDGAETLAEAWRELGDFPSQSAALAVLRPAFATLAALHARGLVHEDLHLGNFLRCGEEVFVIDGDAVRAPGGGLASEAATTNLALLLAQLPREADAWRDDLLSAYRNGGGVPISAALLGPEVERLRAWRLRDYLGKTLRDCTLFAAKRSLTRFSVLERDAEDCLRSVVADPDRAIARGTMLKDGNSATVARVEEDGAGAGALVIKRYNIKSFAHLVSRFWRPTRAWHSWREGHRLAFLGIATPAPLALVEERCGPLRRRGFLVTAHCPGVNLLELLRSDALPDEQVARAIVGLFTRLHECRISHGDLKATNLIWHAGRVYVIDLDAMAQHRSARAHARAWRRDRARFLRNWPEASPLYRWLDEKLPPA